MGWDSYFDGKFTIDPPVSEGAVKEILENDPPLWRTFEPWEIDEEGAAIMPPEEGERASDADENLVALVGMLAAAGHIVNGECTGVNDEDVHWKYVVTNNEVAIYNGFIAYHDGTTEAPGMTVTIHQGEGS